MPAIVERKLRLTDRRIREIRSAALGALKAVQCESAPVPVDRVAKALGAEVLFAPYEGDDLAGMLINARGQKIIAVNSAHHQNRQRFTIAHECGHLVLGHKAESHIDQSFEVIRRDKNSSTATVIEEIEANQYAAELLMPFRFMAKDMAGAGIDFESDAKIGELARKYMVSPQAMAYRIANLFM